MPPHTASPEAFAHLAVVDDDPALRALLGGYLERHGYRVSPAADAAALWRLFDASPGGTGDRIDPVDLVLLDLGLPDADGLDVLRELREAWTGPLIVVSGQGEPVDRIVGLELGADDYIAKPFVLREVLARVRSVLRRPAARLGHDAAPRLEFDELVLEPGAHRLTGRDGLEIRLTSGEFKLLEVLAGQPNRALSRDQLMDSLHGYTAGPFDRAIDVQVGRLRRKIEREPAHPRLIRSIRGAGYLLAAPVTRHAAD
jgi:two-component system, OmpR family, response regulator